jgi:hypothetical protein
MKEKGSEMKISFNELSKTGYGVPLAEEIVTNDELSSKENNGKDIGVQFEKIARERMPEEFKRLEEIQQNISIFNDEAIKVRKEYRAMLEDYIHQVIHNLVLDETTRSLLIDIQSGDTSRIKDLRNLLDAGLVSEKEILDSKLMKFVSEELSH